MRRLASGRHERPRRPLPLFDSLRAIAALSVLTYHVTYGGLNGLVQPWRAFAAHLDVGVAIFFVISGFLLYRPFVLARLRGEAMPRTSAYAWRRFLRIVPAYWVALTIVALWLGYSYVFTANGILTFYGFDQTRSSIDSVRGIGQAWTLDVEICFYALLPLWALGMRLLARGERGRVVATEALGLAVMVAISFGYQLWVRHNMAPETTLPYTKWFPSFLDQFAAGMALAVASAWRQTTESTGGSPRSLSRVPSACWAMAAVVYLLLCLEVGGGHPRDDRARVRGASPAVLARGARRGGAGRASPRRSEGVVGAVLRNRALLLVGLWSYGIYLYHVAVVTKLLNPVRDLLPSGALWQNLGLWVPTFAVSAALAGVSYYLVERPALSLKRRFPLYTPAERGEAIAEPAPAVPAIYRVRMEVSGFTTYVPGDMSLMSRDMGLT